MMNRLGIVMAVTLTAFPLGSQAQGEIDMLVGLLEGSFDNNGMTEDAPADDRMIDKRIRISAPQIGEYVLYQQINHRELLDVYRQRVLVLSTDEFGAVIQNAYALREPEWYVDATRETFERLTYDDLVAFMPEGCQQTWTQTADGYRGYVDPAMCSIISSRTGKQRLIEAESIVSQSTLKLAERGFDPETGEQLFGTEPGEFLLLRRVD